MMNNSQFFELSVVQIVWFKPGTNLVQTTPFLSLFTTLFGHDKCLF